MLRICNKTSASGHGLRHDPLSTPVSGGRSNYFKSCIRSRLSPRVMEGPMPDPTDARMSEDPNPDGLIPEEEASYETAAEMAAALDWQ